MKKFLTVIILSSALLAACFLFPIAYEHRGFFAYHSNILFSRKNSQYQTELLSLVKTDPTIAFKRFREILTSDPLTHNTCHGIAHQMGHESFEVFGFEKAMKFQDGLCGGGYIHGIIEARFGLLQEKSILEVLPTICTLDDSSCYHGIGHGLMIATKLNIQESLRYCDLLSSTGPKNCYDGVWMHVFDAEESGARQTGAENILNQGKATALCAEALRPYKTSCYFYLPRMYAHGEEEPFTVYQTLCARVEKPYQSTCAVGAGHSLMKYHIANPSTSFVLCSEFSSADLAAACKEGGALYYLFDKVSAQDDELNKNEQVALCKVFNNEKDQKICEKVVGYREKSF